MNIRTVMVVGLALACGLSAAFGVSLMKQSAPVVEMAPIVVAEVELSRGVAITAEMVKTIDWPKDRLPDGVLTRVEDAEGRSVVIPLLKGEPVLTQKIAEPGFGRGMAPLVVPGMRAFTVLTPTLTSGVGGLVLPGNKVDVLWTATATGIKASEDDFSGGGSTVTLLQNIEILAADQQFGNTDDKPNKELRSVTLQVSESDAKKLSLAQQKGTINLALRNSGDADHSHSPTVTLNDIRYPEGRAEEAAPEANVKPPAPRQPIRVRIRTLHGNLSGQVQLELHGKAAVEEPAPILDPAKQASMAEL